MSSVFVTRLEDLFSDAMTRGADSCSQGGRREWTGQTIDREPRQRAWSDIGV